MDFYELDLDEAIIIQSSNVTRDGYDESEFEDEYLREIILTNKRIMYVIAPDEETDAEDCDIITVPLNAIKVINGQAQVKQVQHDLYNLCLQVQFVHGVEYWRFGIKAKQQIPVWVNKISDAVRSIPEDCECTHQKSQTSSVHQNKHTSSADTCFCVNCGAQISRTAKFCSECGARCGEKIDSNGDRKVIYDGVVHKCPNCGELLDAFELKCESCGYELRGNKGSTVVQDFANEIRRLEEEGGRGVSKRIATYISTFPIPNSREELLEFFVLSASNIDLKAYGFGASDMADAKKSIAYAYHSKFEQAYRKAQAIFGNDKYFVDFSSIYQQKKQEIATTKRNRVIIILAIVFGSLLLTVGLPLMVIALTGGFG